MNRKVLQIALGMFVVIFVIGGIAFFLLRNSGDEQILIDTDGELLSFLGNLPTSGNLGESTPVDTQPTLSGVGINDARFGSQVVAEDLKKRSINFIERLGSYSSDSNLSNFDDVLPQTAAGYEIELRSMKSNRLLEYASSELFIGYTVTAVTANASLSNLNNGIVNVTIDAIRDISGLQSEATMSKREIYRIEWLYGEDGKWRVNGVSGDF